SKRERVMKYLRLLPLSALLGLSFFLCGFGFFNELALGRHAQKKEHHEIIKMLQPSPDKGEELSARHLFFLAVAYYEIRDYRKAFTAAS
ncbi:MAG: hypothetical protein PHF23_08690, partial [Smithellaceae bacterium]|nr:hypothetical protein [Smithellaceae bacterium]